MTPVVTLTTDFGTTGPFVGVVKAVIHRYAPGTTVIDLTHSIAPYAAGEAGFWLSRSYHYFPARSVHVVVVDPGVGTERKILACEWDGHLFLAPDNGILPMIAGAGTALHELSPQWLATQGWPVPSRTFHGRDIFAPLAAALAAGRARIADIGPVAANPTGPAVAPPARQGNTITGSVVAIDTWGNLITNIDGELLSGIANPRVNIGPRDLRLMDTYGAAAPGALLALINSFGTVEIAWREGNAAELLQLGRGARVTVTAGD
jgi:hypothetical protein